MAKDIGKRVLDRYKKLLRDPKFSELADEFGLNPKNKDFAEELSKVVQIYNEIKNSENNNTDNEQIDTKDTPKSEKKGKKQIHLPDEVWKKYNRLLKDDMFNQMAKEAGLNLESYTKSKDFISDFEKLEAMYNEINGEIEKLDYTESDAKRDKETYDKLMNHKKFEKIAKELGVDPNSKDFAKTLNEAVKKYYKNVTKKINKKYYSRVEKLKSKSSAKNNNDNAKDIPLNDSWTWDSVINEPTAEELNNSWTWDSVINEPTAEELNNAKFKSGQIIDAEFNETIDMEDFKEDFEKARNLSRARNPQGTPTEDLSAFYNEALNNYNQDTREFDINYERAKQEHQRKLKQLEEQEQREVDEIFEHIRNSYEVAIKFNAEKGMYELWKGGHLIYDRKPKKMSARQRRRYAEEIDRKHSYLKASGKEKDIDIDVYELLELCDESFPRADGKSLSIRYLRSLEEVKVSKEEGQKTLLNKIEYDFRGKNKIFLGRHRIKEYAKEHEEMGLAEVKRDPKKKGLKGWVAVAIAGIGLVTGGSTGGATYLLNSHNEVETSTTVEYNEGNKDKTPEKDKHENKNDNENRKEDKSETNKNENSQDNAKQDNNTQDNIKQDNNTQSNVNNPKEEVQISEKEDLVIGKEVTVSAEKLYSSCEYAKSTCDVAKFMKNNPDAKFILGRVAVKTANGYPVNTTLENTSLDELKEKYGEDGVEYWCNFRVEVPGGTYIDIGWANEKDVQIKEEMKKENPWQLDQKYVKATNEAGRSGVNKGTENAIKDTLKGIGIEADF